MNGKSGTYKAYLVVDFEATCCDRGTVPREEMEIIEVGAVMVLADDWMIVDEFQNFIRPVRHPLLTPFCRNLTSIRQEEVDAAPQFKEVALRLANWLASFKDFAFCSWGDYDRKQLQQDCDFHQCLNPIAAPHLNVKKLFAEKYRIGKPLGLGQAIRKANLTFSGTPHRGIDDARNIARLLPLAIKDPLV